MNMSNYAELVATRFIDNHSSSESYGYRLYDSYGMDYDNNFDADILTASDSTLLRYAYNCSIDNPANDILESAMANNGIHINGTFYDTHEVTEILHDLIK
jgi:hypothetical protein